MDDNLALLRQTKNIGIAEEKAKIALLNDAPPLQAFPMLKKFSCLATLLTYYDSKTAFPYCYVHFKYLTVQPIASNIRHSRRLILAVSSNNQLTKRNYSDSNPLNSIIILVEYPFSEMW